MWEPKRRTGIGRLQRKLLILLIMLIINCLLLKYIFINYENKRKNSTTLPDLIDINKDRG